MKHSLKTKTKTQQPKYEHTTEEQTMLYWRLQQQRNGRSVPGHQWNTRDALACLNDISYSFSLPHKLIAAADKLTHEIIVAAKPKKPKGKQAVTTQILTIQK